MASFSKLSFNFMLIGLIVFSLFSFVIQFQSENNSPLEITDNVLVNDTFGDLKTRLTAVGDESQDVNKVFESDNPLEGFGSILLFSIVNAGRTFNSMIIGVFNIIIRLPVSILGIDPIITSILVTMLAITFIIGLWAVYKLGG